MELRLRQKCFLSVKARVIKALQQFPATVRELEADGCGSRRSIQRALHQIDVVRMSGGRQPRYALRDTERYKLL